MRSVYARQVTALLRFVDVDNNGHIGYADLERFLGVQPERIDDRWKDELIVELEQKVVDLKAGRRAHAPTHPRTHAPTHPEPRPRAPQHAHHQNPPLQHGQKWGTFIRMPRSTAAEHPNTNWK